jgi:hypothetical protein
MAKFDRGRKSCSTDKCGGEVRVSVLLVATSPGGRAERKQYNSGTFRLCSTCAKGLGTGKIPAQVKKGITNALWQAGIEA